MKDRKIFNPRLKIIANVENAIEHIETGYTAPVLIEVDPSNACNHACNFCLSSYIHFEKYKGTETFSRALMSRDVLMSLCKDFVDMGVKAVNWTGGGEPTLNKHLKEAIEYCGKNGIKMGMFTNGTLFDKRDLFETLVDNMTWVRISIDAGTKQTYNGIRVARDKQDWDKMVSNLQKLIEVNKSKGNKIDIGVGYVVSPDTYREIVEFAEFFKDYDLSYCQYKPEVIIREDGGVQRDRDFWLNKVEPLLAQAKSILGDKFQINGYKFNDLENNTETYGRNYKKCLGSQLSPCIGADGHVYVCTNHRGWKQYSYGNLYDDSFKSIWGNLQKRKEVMSLIEDVECFENCTKLCKPHESNKAMWDIQQGLENNTMTKEALLKEKEEVREFLKHPEFI
jgi:sulfatase maturation enzyme AslB (radical SAM superfamily)